MLWLSISNLNNTPDSLLLFSRLIQNEDDLFQIDRDDDEYEILRRSQSEVYFYEKLRIFEKTFGIDDLKSLVGKIDQKRMSAINMDSLPEERVVFSPEELENYINILEEFE